MATDTTQRGTELALFIENNSDLYFQTTKPIIKSAERNKKNGTFNQDRFDFQVHGLIKDGANKYLKEFGFEFSKTAKILAFERLKGFITNEVDQIIVSSNQNSRVLYKLDTTQIDSTITSIIDCIEYWNRTIQNPPKTTYKTQFGTNLKSMSADAFRVYLLDMMLSDCQIYVNEGAPYRVGKSGSHVWVHSTEFDTRVLMIFVGGE